MSRPPGHWVRREVPPERVDAHWREAEARLERPAPRWKLVAAVAVAATLVLVGIVTGLLLRRPEPPALEPGAPLVAERAPTSAALPDGSRLELEAGSAVSLTQSGPTRVEVLLTRGTARFDVARRPERRFRVVVDDVAVEVVGTAFSVRRAPDGLVEVRVTRGLVDVSAEGLLKRLSAGETWVREPLARRPEAPTPTVAEAAPQPTPGPAPEADRKKPARRPTTPPPAEPAPSAPTADTLFLEALTARREARWADAARASEAFLERFPNDTRAALVSVELGRLLSDKLGRHREAIGRFERALAMETSGEVREEALLRLIRALEAVGDLPACRARQDEYLRRFPGGAFPGTVRAACGASPARDGSP